MSNRDEPEPFLSRWSRMKRGASQPHKEGQTSALTGADTTSAGETAELQPGASQTDEEPLDLDTLPRVEELTAESDIAAFLDRRVPAALRNAALSRMWTLDPTIRDFIEVAENQWDWNTPGGAPFYELMEPGSAAETLVADATSAISRAFSGPGECADPDVGVATSDVSSAVDPQKVEVDALHDAAAQQDGPIPASGSATTAVAQPHESEGSTLHVEQPVALQHEIDCMPPPRRRHGGALPA